MNEIKILGVKIDNITKKEALDKVRDFLISEKQNYIVTTNPEFLVGAKKDEEFYNILNRSTLSLADGFGMVLMSRVFPPKIKEHIRGSDLTNDILKIAEDGGHKVCIINWSGGLSNRTEIEDILRSSYPNLNLLVQDIKKDYSDLNLNEINKFSPAILFVTLGAPFQEKLIYNNLSKISSVRVAMGVGGTFDFLTGKIKRAPKIIQKIELEWLWRLIKQPRLRIKRIITAVIIFPYVFLIEKIFHPFLYRPNVACLLYKKFPDGVRIFVAEREDLPDHWQIPQGGTDGESLRVAGEREILEEVGTDKIIIKKVCKNLHRYKWGYGSMGYKHSNYKGQKQGLLIAEFIGDDKDVKIFPYDFITWEWVSIDKVLDKVHPVRRKAMEKFLEKLKEVEKI